MDKNQTKKGVLMSNNELFEAERPIELGKIQDYPDQIEEKENQAPKNFDIDVLELEKIMGNYKERGTNYNDLKYFEENPVEGLLSRLKTNTETGVTDLSGREEDFGSNAVFTEEVPHFCSFVWEALGDLMIRILIVSAVVSIVLGCTLSEDKSKDWIDGCSIVIAILVVVLVSSITDYQKAQKFHELNDVQAQGTKYILIRNGQPEEHISDDLLVGDLIMINYGDIMVADILVVEGNSIKMDESALTGESDAMKKEPFNKCLEIKNKQGGGSVPSPLILSGTNCIEGSGKGIVIAVGEHSQKGIIRRTVDNAQEDSKTPLEEKLERMAEIIGYFGLGAGLITLVAMLIRFAISFSQEIKEYKKDSKIESMITTIVANFPEIKNYPEITSHYDNEIMDPKLSISKKILNIVMLCISIIAVAIPEGLPLAVTLSLAFSIKKMMDYNNLVRKMHACETMGGANYICTDKTGTLTKNEMSVFQVLTGKGKTELKQNVEIENVGKIDEQTKGSEDPNNVKQIREDYTCLFKSEKYWNTLKVAIALNVDCTIKSLEKENINGDTEIAEAKNKTDKAFVDFLYRFKSPISEQQNKYLKEGCFKQFPFDSKKKRMTTFIQSKDFPNGYRLFSKGGGENARVFCDSYLDPDTGEKKKMDDGISSQIKQSIEEFNKDKLRSLYVAYKDITKAEYESCEKTNKDNKLIDQYGLTFLCVFGIRDSLRDGVKEAVNKCHSAGVNVIMVTGDNIVTATAIAKDCYILGEEVDLRNLGPKDIEDDPEMMNNNQTKDKYIESLIINQPYAITGNSFYKAVGGLECLVCGKDTSECKCPKTEAEAKQIAEKNKEDPKEIKKEAIKNMENFKKITERLRVMARSQPMHKYALVLGLKALKNVVAVTGDGTNDAPALSKSDVGFAMFAGTDIAKEASDIVIIDNNFSSIVTAIIYGRNIYDNIRKFLQFQLSVNFCACVLVFICACVGNETPLTPIQMLWVNLIMDSLGSLALATEPPYNELLERKPTRRNESIINGRMWKHIVIQSFFQFLLLLALYLFAPYFIKEDDPARKAENTLIHYCYGQLPQLDIIDAKGPEYIIFGTEGFWKDVRLSAANKEYCGKYANRITLATAYNEYINSNDATTHLTMIYNIFVFYTLFNQINCRVIDDSINIFVRINRSLLFPIIMLAEAGLQVLIIFVGSSAFHVVRLTGIQWGISLGFSAVTFVVSLLAKLIPIHVPIDKCLDAKAEKEEKEEETKEGDIKEGKEEKIEAEKQNKGKESERERISVITLKDKTPNTEQNLNPHEVVILSQNLKNKKK